MYVTDDDDVRAVRRVRIKRGLRMLNERIQCVILCVRLLVIVFLVIVKSEMIRLDR